MRVRVVYFEGCPNHEPGVALVREVASSVGVAVEIDEVRVGSQDEAERERMLGSPTIQVEGLDIEPGARARTDFAMSCRVYGGRDGLPPRAMIAAALGGSEAGEGDGARC